MTVLQMDQAKAPDKINDIEKRQKSLKAARKIGSGYFQRQEKKSDKSQYYYLETIALGLAGIFFLSSIVSVMIEASIWASAALATVCAISLLAIPYAKLRQSSKPTKTKQTAEISPPATSFHAQYSRSIKTKSARIASEHQDTNSPAVVTSLVAGFDMSDEEIQPASLEDLNGVKQTKKKPRV